MEQIHKKTRKLKPSIELVEDEGENEELDEPDPGPANLRKKLILQNATIPPGSSQIPN